MISHVLPLLVRAYADTDPRIQEEVLKKSSSLAKQLDAQVIAICMDLCACICLYLVFSICMDLSEESIVKPKRKKKKSLKEKQDLFCIISKCTFGEAQEPMSLVIIKLAGILFWHLYNSLMFAQRVFLYRFTYSS